MKYRTNKEGVSSRIVDHEAVVLNLGNSHYYSINFSGTAIWQMMDRNSVSIDSLSAFLSQRFEVEDHLARSQTEQFLEELRAEGLIIPVDSIEEGEQESIPLENPGLFGEYTPPRILKFDQLEKLILSAE